jgi:ribosomal protein S18 acetylase RimI-like enzyme
MEIVRAKPTEAATLGDLHRLTWEATYCDYAGEAWHGEQLAAHALRDWEEIIRAQVSSGGGVLVAKRDGAIGGFCQYGPAEDESSLRAGHIYRLYVHPAQQRSGVGRSLLTAAVECLRQNGAEVATLWVLESDRRARAFYGRMGWEPDGARTADPTDLRYRICCLNAVGPEPRRPRPD